MLHLKYHTQVNLNYFQRGIIVRYIRIIADVSFETKGGWTQPMEAIIDTGGPVSVIPRSVWEQVRYGFYSNQEIDVRLGGNGTMGRLGQVILRFHDAEGPNRISQSLTIKAYLLSDDSYPIIVGFDDVLTHVELHSNFPQEEVYLVFPQTR